MALNASSEAEEFEHQQALNRLLGLAAHRAGGLIRYTRADEEELQALYGEPTPILVGVDDQGPFALVAPLEELEDKGWPLMASAMDEEEREARAYIRPIVEALRRARDLRRLRAARRQDRRN
jgi:hypothetical protein